MSKLGQSKDVNRNNGIDWGLIVALSVFISYTICFFAPLSIYLANITDFWFSLRHLLPLILAVFVSCSIAVLITFILLNSFFPRLFLVIYTLVYVIAVGLFVQGNLINNGDSLNGAKINYAEINSGAIISTILWISVLGVFLFVNIKGTQKRLLKTVKPLLMLITAIQLVSLGVMLLIGRDSLKKDDYVTTAAGQFQYSDKNFIIIVLDAFDARVMEEYMDEDARNVLQDFTFFPDTMSMYGGTVLSLPQLLTGKEYHNETTFPNYLSEAYDSSPVFNYFIDNEWNVGVYLEGMTPSGEVAEYAVNVEKSKLEIKSKRRFLKYIYQLVAYNYAPYYTKSFFWFYPDVINDTKYIAEEGTEPYSWENEAFYRNTDVEVANEEKGTFRAYHLKGMHGPLDHDRFLNPVASESATKEDTFMGNMLMLDKYFRQLRDSGIYDDSIIIVLADHGSNQLDGYCQNPLLLIKGLGEEHEFIISDKRVSYEHLQTIYDNLLNGLQAEDAVDIGVGNTRRYFTYDTSNTGNKLYFGPICEYVTDSVADDYKSLKETGIVYEYK